jgi:two-component system chemotaxis sensor kinase CheA
MSSTRPTTEFVPEAQEVVEEFSRRLLELEAAERAGVEEPEALNAAFRAIHSLKGLAALFAAGPIATLSHSLENALDALRLGKVALGAATLDVLFEAVESFAALLVAHESDAEPPTIEPLLARIDSLVGRIRPERAATELPGIDESILGVLTEYEEHRLRENFRLGRTLYRVHASFDLLAIDVGIEGLKARLKEFGEVITYLPSADSSADDRIDLDILLGSTAELAEVTAALSGEGVGVHPLIRDPPPRQGSASAPTRAIADDDGEPRMSPPPRGMTATAIAGDTDTVGDDVDVAPDVSLRSISRTVRVDLARLDQLMNLIGEIGVAQATLLDSVDRLRRRASAPDLARELSAELRTLSRKVSLLQQGVLDVRMVPLGQVFDKLARVIRKLGREAGKEIRLGISGEETELDKLIVEELSDPLMHMIRNCIDHGIESKAERLASGKPAIGRVELRAFQRGSRVVLEVEDDGRGIDLRQIRESAVRRGLHREEDLREMTPQQIIELVFMPGFTTRSTPGVLSGRGVGMDVVKTNISRLSGIIDVNTTVGRGTTFSITLPVTLAIIQALVVQTAGQTFCIPLNSVLESVMVGASEIRTVDGAQVITLHGKTLPLCHLARLFDLRRGATTETGRIYVIVVGLAQHRVGLVVDDLLGQRDVVIKSIGSALRSVPGIAGATELGGGRTVLLLDVAALVEEAVGREIAGPAASAPSEAYHGA